MANQTRVVVLFETSLDEEQKNEWTLWFQYCKYEFADGNSQFGYRFIWKTPENRLQPARGQARIPSIETAKELMEKAIEKGWGNYEN